MTNGTIYEWEYINIYHEGEFRHIAIFNKETGNRVGWAASEVEALETIDSLENHRMNFTLSYAVSVTAEYRRAINRFNNKPGLATAEEVTVWLITHGRSKDNDLLPK